MVHREALYIMDSKSVNEEICIWSGVNDTELKIKIHEVEGLLTFHNIVEY